MEMSSPLAAMHPPPLPGPWGYRRDLPPSKPLFANSYGQNNFNFRDMSMKKPTSDYFSLQPIPGSSPTATLAADMSSNLHVDQSPQLATPRRSLFTTNLFQQADRPTAGTTTPPVRWEGVTTPPIPSSSPNFVPDSMDISPLPHKLPFSFVSERLLPSPSPIPTPPTNDNDDDDDDDDMISPCELPTPPQFPIPTPEIEGPRPVSAAERRKSILLRPSLSRTKTFSTNTVSFKSRESNVLPAFKFGAGVDAFAASAASLDECFAASPPQDRRPASNPLQTFAKPKPFGLQYVNASRAAASPLAASNRKPVGPPSRRPTKFRRSLSMFEHPADVMNAKPEKDSYASSGLQSVMDVDDSRSLKLPHFTPPNEPDSLPRITDGTLIQVLNGEYDHLFAKRVVVDCRFEYEYTGGHIQEAVNYCDKEALGNELFAPAALSDASNTLLILHCEYSAHRAPLMAKFVRNEDRKVNAHRYPELSYPEVYILDGGYSSFYASNRSRCFPQNYLRMDAEEHQEKCERGMNKLRQRAKLSRAHTFAMGQSCNMEESPTATGRSNSGGVLTLSDDTFLGRLGGSRRMASY